MSSAWIRGLANVGAIAIGAIAVLALQWPKLEQKLAGQTREADRQWVTREAARLKFLQSFPSHGFGFNNLIADVTFLDFLQYFGDDKARVVHETGYALSPEYFEAILRRDPRFIYSYLYMSVSTSIFAGQPQRAIALYERGLKVLIPEILPYAYTVWRQRAIDELLFLGDTQAARRSFLKAAEWVERATFGPDALEETKTVAQTSRATAEFLRTNPDSTPARIGAWVLVLSTAVDRKTTQIAIAELDKLGIAVVFEAGKGYSLRPKQSNQPAAK